ncbi:hypothetical protein [Pontibacter sp. SGAir0037]|uniref:hypothetical protein n=1 Tax=Pontibacter sp. SGAir0037 TaxID=2571030 RepID=UPI0010CD4BDC|nr:hypothetical protein [Pontibacter sp. SGAir0037]QCR22622.1 hypothetical protein C1N53_09905 [Pontibacter sp. SGAir0037]
MERDNWNRRRSDFDDRDQDNRYRNNNRFGNNAAKDEEDSYRGAYRFDNTSDHHNQSTYNGFDRSGNRNQHNYRNEQGRQDNVSGRNRFNERDDYSSGNDYRNTRDSVHDRMNRGYDNRERYSSNFNNDYGSDNYRSGRGENYGNMAGSLSFGYDGDNNADPDANRMYNPLSGRRHSYHGNYSTRRPDNFDNRRNRPDDRYREDDRY